MFYGRSFIPQGIHTAQTADFPADLRRAVVSHRPGAADRDIQTGPGLDNGIAGAADDDGGGLAGQFCALEAAKATDIQV